MKKLLLFLIAAFSFINGKSQCPTDPIELTSQSDIDNFAQNYPNCTILLNDLKIDGETNVITNLNGLSQITNTADLYILRTEITSFTGLENLQSTEHFSVGYNNAISDLSGLTALESVEEINVWFNGSLTSLDGAQNLQSLVRLNLFENPVLEDLSELSDIQTLVSLSIAGNGLSTLAGLENLQTVQEDIFISNEAVINLNALSNLNNFSGSLYFWNNPQLTDISVFIGLEEVEDLIVVECPSLTDLSGFNDITTVHGIFRIGFNPQLTDLSVFSNLTEVGALDIYENQNLETLSGLDQLLTAGQSVYIMDNPQLNDISALEFVDPAGLNELVIARNDNLAVCDNQFVCAVVFDPDISEQIQDNAIGCSSIPQVAANCFLGTEEMNWEQSIAVVPNPAKQLFHITSSLNITIEQISLYSITGQLLLESDSSVMDISHFQEGVYFLKIDSSLGSLAKRIIKN